MSCKKTPEQWLAEIHQRVETQPAGTLKWITAIQEDAERNPLKRIAELEKDLEAANRLAFEYSQKMPTTAQAMVYQNLLEKYNAVKEDGKRLDWMAKKWGPSYREEIDAAMKEEHELTSPETSSEGVGAQFPTAKPVEPSDVERIVNQAVRKYDEAKLDGAVNRPLPGIIRGALAEAIAAKDAEIAALKIKSYDWQLCAEELLKSANRIGWTSADSPEASREAEKSIRLYTQTKERYGSR